MKNYVILVIISLLFCQSSASQKFNSQEKRKAVEDILNAVINSDCFRKVYNFKIVYFEANELLTEDSELNLTKNGKKVLIVEKVPKGKPFASLAHFFIYGKDSAGADVQLYISIKGLTLNIGVRKINNLWFVDNCDVIPPNYTNHGR